MALASTHHELDDLGGGRFRHTQNMRAIAHYKDGSLVRNVNDWADGDAAFPHIVLDSSLAAYVASDGTRRMCPNPADTKVWVEFGAPCQKVVADWSKVPIGTVAKSTANLDSQTAQWKVRTVHAGHYVKQEYELLGGWRPANGQLLFPVTLNGLTRKDDEFVDGKGVVVAHLRPPVVYDAANLLLARKITHEWTRDGLLFTLPDLKGITRPVVDPTFVDGPGGDTATNMDAGFAGAPGAVNTNFGTNILLFMGWFDVATPTRSLIQFDLSSIPTTATVTSSTIALIRSVNFGAYAYTFGAYQVLRAWTEAGITWNKYDGVSAWGIAGCNDTSTDRSGTAENAHNIDFSGNNSWSIPTMTQNWVTTPANNHGVLICTVDVYSSDADWRPCSSDHATVGNRPTLTVIYTLPLGAHPVFSGVAQGVFHGVA